MSFTWQAFRFLIRNVGFFNLMMFRSPQQVIDMHKYRKSSMLERVVSCLGYGIYFYLGLKVSVLSLFPFLMLFLLTWVICRNSKLNTPTFIKYHVAHAFALVMILDVSRLLIEAILAVFASTLDLFSLDYMSEIRMGFLMVWFGLIVLLFIFNCIQVFKGLQHDLPLSSKLARRIVY